MSGSSKVCTLDTGACKYSTCALKEHTIIGLHESHQIGWSPPSFTKPANVNTMLAGGHGYNFPYATHAKFAQIFIRTDNNGI